MVRVVVFLFVLVFFSGVAFAGEPQGLGAAQQFLKTPAQQPGLNNNGDIDSTVQQLMLQSAKDSEQDLKDQMQEMKEKNKQKKEMRGPKKNMKADQKDPCGQKDRDCLDELNEQDTLKLQQTMERKEKLESMMSNTMKKADDTQNGVINNLK